MIEPLRLSFEVRCDADHAFDPRRTGGPRLKALFASDIGHWDVPDIREVLPEAWELVEDGDATVEQTPAAVRMSIKFEERIRDLERSLGEERRALQEAEIHYRELEQRYRELLASSSGKP